MLPAERPVRLFPSRFQVNERRGTARAVFNGTVAELGGERIPGGVHNSRVRLNCF